MYEGAIFMAFADIKVNSVLAAGTSRGLPILALD